MTTYRRHCQHSPACVTIPPMDDSFRDRMHGPNPTNTLTPWMLLHQGARTMLFWSWGFLCGLAALPKRSFIHALIIALTRLILRGLACLSRNTLWLLWAIGLHLYVAGLLLFDLLASMAIVLFVWPVMFVRTLYQAHKAGCLRFALRLTRRRAIERVSAFCYCIQRGMSVIARCVILRLRVLQRIAQEVRMMIQYRRTERALRETFCQPPAQSSTPTSPPKATPAQATTSATVPASEATDYLSSIWPFTIPPLPWPTQRQHLTMIPKAYWPRSVQAWTLVQQWATMPFAKPDPGPPADTPWLIPPHAPPWMRWCHEYWRSLGNPAVSSYPISGHTTG